MADFIQDLAAWKAYLVFGWLVLFFALERLRPAAKEDRLRQGRAQPVAGGWARLGRNGGLWLCNVGLSLAVVLPISAWAAAHPLFERPALLTGWTGLVFDILLLDFLIYWWHRANHEVGFLWRFHEVHHLDRFLDTTSALRFHFGEVLLSALARAVVIVVFAVPFATVVVFEVLILLAAIFHHSNLRLPRRLEAGLRCQLRHDLQLLGPALRQPQPDAARSGDGDRRRRPQGRAPARPALPALQPAALIPRSADR